MTPLGVPLTIWGVVCLMVSAVWIFVWPSQTSASGAPRFILRWFHTLVWLFLAAAAFIAGLNLPGGVKSAQLAAEFALLAYLVFMITLAIAGRK
jgi:hypothetical protein